MTRPPWTPPPHVSIIFKNAYSGANPEIKFGLGKSGIWRVGKSNLAGEGGGGKKSMNFKCFIFQLTQRFQLHIDKIKLKEIKYTDFMSKK